MEKGKAKNRTKVLFLLHVIIMLYSMSGIFSKAAAGEPFLSLKFCLYYGIILLILGLYAIFWQQIIKRLPLTSAFANKAVTVIWGIIWGFAFFNEPITVGKLAGACIVIAGVVIFVSDKSGEQGDADTADKPE